MKSILQGSFDELLGVYLKRRRKTLKDFCQYAGLSAPTFRVYRKHPGAMSLDVFQALCRFLDITEDAEVMRLYHSTQRRY